MSDSLLVVTAADARYFELAAGAIASIRERTGREDVKIAFLDLGCTPEQLRWLQSQVQFIRAAEWEFDFPARAQAPAHHKGLLVRPYLRRYFPGHDLYLWIDADAWVQDWSAVELFLRGAARRRGLAIVPEIDRGSRIQYGGLPGYWEWARRYYAMSFGASVASELCSYPMLNAGVYALHRDAPHWEAWDEALRRGLRQATETYMADQAALNLVVHRGALFDRTELLPAWCNWTCHYGLPAWDAAAERFVEPYLPHHPIGILHLSGVKHDRVRLTTTALGAAEVSLRYALPTAGTGPVPAAATPFPPWDYVSPGFALVRPDAFFPHLTVGDRYVSPWPFLRREIPHNWYVDRRAPTIGLLNRDEVHLLYNTALQFRGRRALEIGCWRGWSTCHLALAGVELDVVDPALSEPEFRDQVEAVLTEAGVLDRVSLTPGFSPIAVEELAGRDQRRWSLCFIDGNHEVPFPLYDAEVCARFAADDALVLFHDLAAPDVAQGLDYLKRQGWRTVLYQTMQVMGAAWRGGARPVAHIPDPAVSWVLPSHLTGHPVCRGEDLT